MMRHIFGEPVVDPTANATAADVTESMTTKSKCFTSSTSRVNAPPRPLAPMFYDISSPVSPGLSSSPSSADEEFVKIEDPADIVDERAIERKKVS